jgi:hypothetical protein
MARAMRNNERVLQLTLSILAFGAGVWLMVEGAEKFTEGVLRLSTRLGVATFVLGYLLSGIDLENLAVGVASRRLPRGSQASASARSSAPRYFS